LQVLSETAPGALTCLPGVLTGWHERRDRVRQPVTRGGTCKLLVASRKPVSAGRKPVGAR
jgi:hypothetical protein